MVKFTTPNTSSTNAPKVLKNASDKDMSFEERAREWGLRPFKECEGEAEGPLRPFKDCEEEGPNPKYVIQQRAKDYREQIEQSHDGCLIKWNDDFSEKKGECYVCHETKKLVHMTPTVSFDNGKSWIEGRALCEECEEGDGQIPFPQCNLALDCGTVSDLGHTCPSCSRLAGNKDWDFYLYL